MAAVSAKVTSWRWNCWCCRHRSVCGFASSCLQSLVHRCGCGCLKCFSEYFHKADILTAYVIHQGGGTNWHWFYTPFSTTLHNSPQLYKYSLSIQSAMCQWCRYVGITQNFLSTWQQCPPRWVHEGGTADFVDTGLSVVCQFIGAQVWVCVTQTILRILSQSRRPDGLHNTPRRWHKLALILYTLLHNSPQLYKYSLSIQSAAVSAKVTSWRWNCWCCRHRSVCGLPVHTCRHWCTGVGVGVSDIALEINPFFSEYFHKADILLTAYI